MTRRSLIIVFALALGIRLAFLLFVSTRYPVRLDGSELEQVATNIVAGRGFSSPFSDGAEPTAHFAPVVPYVWAVVFRIAGTDTPASAIIIRIMQAVLSAVSVVLYALVAARVRRRWPALPAITPIAVGVVLAFWPESIFKLINTWYFQWQEIGLALTVLTGLRWIDRPSYGTAAAAGASAGALALINPLPAILLAPILAMPILAGGGIRWLSLRQALVGGMVSLLMILPWSVRNYAAFGAIVPVRGNFNLELLQSHHPDASLLQYHRSFHPAVRSDALALYDSLGERAYMDRAGAEAVRHMRENPGLTAARTVRRIGLFWVTDVLDVYRWSPAAPRWWQRCCGFEKANRLATIVSAIVPLALVLLFLFRGAYRPLPYKPVFLGILLVLPLVYYITAPIDRKSMIVRPWLGLLAVLALVSTRQVGAFLRRFEKDSPAAESSAAAGTPSGELSVPNRFEAIP